MTMLDPVHTTAPAADAEHVAPSLPGQLAAELARVAAMRERWTFACVGERGPELLGPEIARMTVCIDLAIRAFDTGDVISHVRALAALRRLPA